MINRERLTIRTYMRRLCSLGLVWTLAWHVCKRQQQRRLRPKHFVSSSPHGRGNDVSVYNLNRKAVWNSMVSWVLQGHGGKLETFLRLSSVASDRGSRTSIATWTIRMLP